MSASRAVSAGYPNGCTTCGAAVGEPCRAKSGRVTDTHRARIDGQFDHQEAPLNRRHAESLREQLRPYFPDEEQLSVAPWDDGEQSGWILTVWQDGRAVVNVRGGNGRYAIRWAHVPYELIGRARTVLDVHERITAALAVTTTPTTKEHQ